MNFAEEDENIDSTNDDDSTATDDDTTSTDDDTTTSDDSEDTSDDSQDTDDQGDDSDDDSDDDENLKLKKANSKLFARAKKAEGFEKNESGEWVKKPAKKATTQKAPELTAMDTIALVGAEVTNPDDIYEVMDFAKLKNITVSEALKSTVVKAILADKSEGRKTADATSTKSGKRGSTKPSDDQVLTNAGKGVFPDDPADLAKARMAKKQSSK